MPPLCAENNNNILACMASSARQEASFVAIAQQLMQHQHKQHAPSHHPFHHQPSMDPWPPSKSDDFTHAFYSDSIPDLLPSFGPDSPIMPPLHSHFPEPEFLLHKDHPLSEPINDDSLLTIQTPELSQTLTSVDDVLQLEGLLPAANTFSDTPAEWMVDCLMYDTDDAIASCFETNPCESTQSSEAAALNPCTPLEDALPDSFPLMEVSDLCTPMWIQDAGNGAATGASLRDVMGMCEAPKDVMGICPSSRDVAGMYVSSMSTHAKRGMIGRCGLTAVKREMDKAGSSSRGRQQHNQVPAHGVQLMQLLLECAKAVENDHQKAAMVIPQLKAQATRYGDPIQRLAAYFTEALSKRLAQAQGRPEPPSLGGECTGQELTLAYKAMNDACPYFLFAQLTANQAILEAIEGAERVHIVDFGISQGVQWAALLQAITAREGCLPPMRIRITGVASPELGDKCVESLAATGRRLVDFARLLHLNLEFRSAPVSLDDATLSAEMFDIDDGEVVVVNFMLELCNLLDGAAELGVARALCVAAELSPKIATVAEMDAPLNKGPFQKRFVSALYFFSAMFDSLEAGMIRDSVHRHCMERWLLGERIHTMVGGPDNGPRRRLQAHGDWCIALQSANFRPCRMSHYAISQARILLWKFCESFTLNEQYEGSLSLGWQNKPLLTVSAWTINV